MLASRDRALLPEIAALMRFILLGSLTCLFLSALPRVLGGLGLSGASLWRTCSASGLTIGVGMSVFASSQRRSLAERQVTRFVLVAWLLAVLAALAHSSNVIGWPLSPSAGVYLAAIWMTLALAAINVVDLVSRFALNDPAA